MNIPGHLARSLLETDFENICSKLKAGGTLTTAERSMLEKKAAAAAPEPLPAPPTIPGDESPFTLALEEPHPTELTRELLAEWSALYQTGARQLRRWWKEGAPLYDPAAMPGWWSRSHTWACPAKILAAAKAAPHAAAPTPLPSAPAAAADPQRSGPEPFNLSDFDLLEGEAVKLQRQRVAALFDQLDRAYKGLGGDIDVLEGKINRAGEFLRKLEKDDRESAKQRGLLIPRLEVTRDLAKLAEMLRQMTDTEVRRVLELCPALSVEARQQVSAAITRVADARQRVLRNLKSLKTPEDALLQLTAA